MLITNIIAIVDDPEKPKQFGGVQSDPRLEGGSWGKCPLLIDVTQYQLV